MSLSSQSIFADARDNIRVKDNRKVSWKLKDSPQKGNGRIKNISSSGMLLETTTPFSSNGHNYISFDADLGPKNYIPQDGRLVWSRQKRFYQDNYLCGIEFMDPTRYVSSRLKDRIDKGLERKNSTQKINTVLQVTLLTVLVGLVGYTFWLGNSVYQDFQTSNQHMLENTQQQSALTQSFANRLYANELMLVSVSSELESTKKLYNESNQMIVTVARELQASKALLAQTQQMLANAQEGNKVLQGAMVSMKDFNDEKFAQSKADFDKQIAALEVQNNEMKFEMGVLRDQLETYQGGIKNTAEGRVLINLFKNRIQEVKGQIKGFKKEAVQIKDAAQKEKDRIRMVIGNNGYFVKNGLPVTVDEKLYESSEMSAVQSPQKINIEVKFVD